MKSSNTKVKARRETAIIITAVISPEPVGGEGKGGKSGLGRSQDGGWDMQDLTKGQHPDGAVREAQCDQLQQRGDRGPHRAKQPLPGAPGHSQGQLEVPGVAAEGRQPTRPLHHPVVPDIACTAPARPKSDISPAAATPPPCS